MSDLEFNIFFKSFKSFTELVQPLPNPKRRITLNSRQLSVPLSKLIEDIRQGLDDNMSEDLSESTLQEQSIDSTPFHDEKPSLINKVTSWSEYEDRVLKETAIQYCRDWKKIQKRIERILRVSVDIKFLKSRFSSLFEKTKKIRGHFTDREDFILMSAVGTVGSNWIKVAEFLPGRCPLMMKNRYYYLKRKNLCSVGRV